MSQLYSIPNGVRACDNNLAREAMEPLRLCAKTAPFLFPIEKGCSRAERRPFAERVFRTNELAVYGSSAVFNASAG